MWKVTVEESPLVSGFLAAIRGITRKSVFEPDSRKGLGDDDPKAHRLRFNGIETPPARGCRKPTEITLAVSFQRRAYYTTIAPICQSKTQAVGIQTYLN